MAKDKVQIEETPFLELPEGSLLVGVQEKDGVKTERKAFRVAQGVVSVDTITENGIPKGVFVKYYNNAVLFPETIHGTQTTGTLVGAEA